MERRSSDTAADDTLTSVAAVLVLRHGITEWNATHRWQGWTDVPLSSAGVAQATAARGRLSELGLRFERTVASDLERAWRTAEILGSTQVEKHIALRERDIGDWAGLTTPQIREGWPGALEAWRGGELERTPNGESESEFSARVSDTLREVCADASRRQQLTLLVCHGGVIHAMERAFGAEHHPVANLAGRWFGWSSSAASPSGVVEPGERVDLLAGLDGLGGASDRRPAGTAL